MSFNKIRNSSNRFDILNHCDKDNNFKPEKYNKPKYNKPKYKKTNNDNSNIFKVEHNNNGSLINAKLMINNNDNFPELTKQSSADKQSSAEQMNYLAVAKREQKVEVIIDTTKVDPGWVRLWKREGIIYSKYGLPTKWRQDEYKRDEEDFKRLSIEILKQWQNEREEITELLGDRSPYYDMPSLLEYLPEDEDNNEEFYNDNDSDGSDNN